MGRVVHFSGYGRTPSPVCKAGSRWNSSVVTTNRNKASVTCKTCKRMLDK